MASSTNIEPQKDRGNLCRFSPLPQSETECNNHEEDLPLSVSVEPTDTMYEHYYSEEIFGINARTCELLQDLLGLILLIMLISLPFYKRLGTPKEDPIPPIFVLNSLYLSNFTIGSGPPDATWDAKFTVTNTNVSSIYFRSIDFTIFYKQNPQNALSMASSYPFYLDDGEYVKLHLKFTNGGEQGSWEDNQPSLENRLVEEMDKEKAKNGYLSFGMQMKVQAIYYGETWVSDVLMNPHCEDLRVQFLSDNVSGRMVNPNTNFSVPLQWKPFSFF